MKSKKWFVSMVMFAMMFVMMLLSVPAAAAPAVSMKEVQLKNDAVTAQNSVTTVTNGNRAGLAKEIMNLVKTKKGNICLDNYKLSSKSWDKLCRYINETYYYHGYQSFCYSWSQSRGIWIDCTSSKKAYTEAAELKRLVRSAMKSAKAASGSQKTRATRIHNWICKKMTYSAAYGDAYTGFKKGKGRCASYASMFALMCKEAGIECKIITGSAKGSFGWDDHAWNRVKVSGTWYYTDVCWDDCTKSSNYLLSRGLWNDHKI